MSLVSRDIVSWAIGKGHQPESRITRGRTGFREDSDRHRLLRGAAGEDIMIALYCEPQGMGGHLEQLLPANQCQPVGNREDFHAAVVRFGTGVFGALECDRADAEWIAGLLDQSLHTACTAVVPLSLGHVQSFRPFLSDRLGLVWLDEAAEQLPDAIRQTHIDRSNPLHLLAHRIILSEQLSPVALGTLEEICCPRPLLVEDVPHRPAPPRNMEDLAARIHHSISGIRVHWKEHVPLRCTPKKLMEWALLMWAVSDPAPASASAQARSLGIHPRTLERICARLIGCRIAQAMGDPDAIRDRFKEWVAEISELPFPSH